MSECTCMALQWRFRQKQEKYDVKILIILYIIVWCHCFCFGPYMAVWPLFTFEHNSVQLSNIMIRQNGVKAYKMAHWRCCMSRNISNMDPRGQIVMLHIKSQSATSRAKTCSYSFNSCPCPVSNANLICLDQLSICCQNIDFALQNRSKSNCHTCLDSLHMISYSIVIICIPWTSLA